MKRGRLKNRFIFQTAFLKKEYGGQSQRQPLKKSRRSPVTASQGSAETAPRPQEKNRLSRLFRHLRQPAKPPRLFFSCPLRRDFYEQILSDKTDFAFLKIVAICHL